MYSKSTNIWSSFAYLCVKVSHNCEEGLYLVDLDPGRLTHFVDSAYDYIWPGSYDPIWPRMAPYGPITQYGLSGLIYSIVCKRMACMALNGPALSRMVHYGPVWSCIVPYGPVWSCMVPYGPVWSRMVPHGHVRSKMVPYGPVWSRMVL